MSANGGPAFPIISEHGERLESAAGLSTRDYFAIRAPEEIPGWFMPDGAVIASGPKEKAARYFLWRWHYADMMLAHRERPNESGDMVDLSKLPSGVQPMKYTMPTNWRVE